MSRSRHAVELCALLVDEIYGELSSRIFTILLRRGRLQISQLARHTRLNSRHVQNGLAVLVQQGLVYYHFDPDAKATFYDANHDAAYGLVRSGKILESIESRYGPDAKDVAQNLFLLGHTKVADLEKLYDSKPNGHINGNGTKPVNGVHGHDRSSHISTGKLHAILIRMLEACIIQPVVKSMLRSPVDTYNMMEKQIMATDYAGGASGGARHKDELRGKIRDHLHTLRSEGQNWRLKGKKRQLNGAQTNGINGAAKRRRLSYNGSSVNSIHQYEDEGARLEPDLVLRINYEKCKVLLRNQRLVALANERIGTPTSLVYAKALDLIEDKIHRCRLDPLVDDMGADGVEGPTFTTMEVAAALDMTVNVAKGVGKENGMDDIPRPGLKNGKMRKAGIGSDDDEEMGGTNGHENGADVDHTFDYLDDPFPDDEGKPVKRPRVTFQDQTPASGFESGENRLLQVKKHLQILEGSDVKFIHKTGARGQGEWGVDFAAIIQYMQEAELDLMMLENYEQAGLRLTRIFRKFGKIDEKQLPIIALMKQKDIRAKLAEMQMAGVMDIQELPKDASRATQRTIFLWYFDNERVSAILLDKIYKSMSRCYQRLDVEKRRAHDVLTLTERSDIRDLPQDKLLEPLGPAQFNLLLEIRAKEEKILGHIHRLDEMVGVFRDY